MNQDYFTSRGSRRMKHYEKMAQVMRDKAIDDSASFWLDLANKYDAEAQTIRLTLEASKPLLP